MLKTDDSVAVAAPADLVKTHEYDAIVKRLQILHPKLDLLEIRVAVELAAQEVGRPRLQLFVPLLVEKIARDECRRLSRSAVLTVT